MECRRDWLLGSISFLIVTAMSPHFDMAQDTTLPWTGGNPMGIVSAGNATFTVNLDALMFRGITLTAGGAISQQDEDKQSNTEGPSPSRRSEAHNTASRRPKPQPIEEWRLESGVEANAPIDKEKLTIRLVIPIKERPTSCPHLVDFISKSRLAVVLPDGSTKSLHAQVDKDKVKQYLYWNSVYERLDPNALKDKAAQAERGVSTISLAMRPADLLQLGPGKHGFTWISGEKKSKELIVQIRGEEDDE
jgi:hypothetical protein